MISRTTVSRAFRFGLGAGALARPRQAAGVWALLLGVFVLVWLILARQVNKEENRAVTTATGASAAEVANLLSRSGYGPGGSDVRVLWATPEYFRFTAQPALAEHYEVEKNLVFFVWENIHDGDLPEALLPALRVDSAASYMPSQVLVPANAVHHRYSVIFYPRYDAQGLPVLGDQVRSLELVLPPANNEGAQSVLYWSLPLEYHQGVGRVASQFTWAALLALLGGVLASMWPCLFQLTAYFIPTLAGMSMSQVREQRNAVQVRVQVMKTAAFFVLGFVIVYTVAGALAGYAAESLNGATLLSNLRGPVSIVAGLVILFIALRLAANSQAPLVCKMPLPFGKKKTGYLDTMLLGLAFASGCTTCFGGVLILSIVTYVGIAGTPLLGAMIMFLFALGMAVPLMVGAMAMARIIGLLCHLEKVAPYMFLASSAIMVAFAALLLSGRYMELSNWFFGRVPV